MSLLDPRDKTISLKVVYYGPGLGGKTTSLKHIHQVIDPEGKVKLVSLDTDEDRTLFFDFLPIELGLVGRFKIKIQGFTVPGQVKYNMTRRYVLTGADGVVFVADSDPSRLVENVESLINLGDNLRAHGLNVNNIPLVFQFNKQDLPNALDPKELEEKLNFRKVPSFATIATNGDSVYDAFKSVAKLMVSRVIKTYNLKQEQADEERILQEVEARLATLETDGMEVTEPVAMPAMPGAPAPAPAPAAPAADEDAAPESPANGPAVATLGEEAEEFFGSFGEGGPDGTDDASDGDTATDRADDADPRPTSESSSRRDEVESAPKAAAIAEPRPARLPIDPPRASEPPKPAAVDRTESSDDDDACDPTDGLPESASRSAKPARSDRPRRARPESSDDERRKDSGSVSTRKFMRSLLEIGRAITTTSADRSATVILSTACQTFDAMGASILVVNEQGALLPDTTNGFRRDPLSQALGSTELLELIDQSGDQIVISEDHNESEFDSLAMVSSTIESAVIIPLIADGQVSGALAVYFDEPLQIARRKDDMRMLMVLASQAAVSLVATGRVKR